MWRLRKGGGVAFVLWFFFFWFVGVWFLDMSIKDREWSGKVCMYVLVCCVRFGWCLECNIMYEYGHRERRVF